MSKPGSRWFDAMNSLQNFCHTNQVDPAKFTIQFVPQDQQTKFNLQIAVRDELIPLNHTIGLKDLDTFQFLGFRIQITGPRLDELTDYGASG